MPSQPYNLVKDDQDIRVPLHSDEAFYNGISFQAKVINFLNKFAITSKPETHSQQKFYFADAPKNATSAINRDRQNSTENWVENVINFQLKCIISSI